MNSHAVAFAFDPAKNANGSFGPEQNDASIAFTRCVAVAFVKSKYK